MYRRVLFLSATLAALVLGFAAVALASNGPLPGDLERVRGTLARYNAVELAERDGYVPSSPCEESPTGTMGIHYVNPSLLGSGIDPLRPPILLYLPDKNGNLKLVAVEYFEVALANTPTGPAPWFGPNEPELGFFNSAPSVFGRTFDGPMAGHSPQMPWHYDLHAWLYEANPAGTFASWNPALSCS